jgi:hypothetical protein
VELQKHKSEFDAAGVRLYAISYDSVDVLSGFAEEYGIEYPLLADVGSSVIRDYGILNTLVRPEEEEHYGIPFPGTYLVEPDGRVGHKFFNRQYRVRETATTVLSTGFHAPVDASSVVSDKAGTDDVTVTAALMATVLHPRQRAEIHVTIDLDEGLHVYGEPIPDGYIPTTVTVTGTEGLSIGEPEYPPTRPFRVEGLNDEFHVFDGEVRIVVPLVSTIREEGTAAVDLEVSYQACTDAYCLIPRKDSLHIEFGTAPSVRPKPKD